MRITQKAAAWWLSVTGLIPFVGLATITIILPGYADLSYRALIAYGMVILSFLGAIHWGAVLKQDSSDSRGISNQERLSVGALIWGVVPSLWAWVTGMFDPNMQGLWLVAGLLLALGVDLVAYKRYGFASWMLPIRWLATCGASLSLVWASLIYRPI